MTSVLIDHPADTDPARLAHECDIQRTRRSGPGGQNRNKVETAVVLLHRPTQTRAEASERRSQGENLQVALFRLRFNLALTVRIKRDAAKIPSELWRSRCRSGKISINAEHDDFPSLIAEVLDLLEANQMEIPPTAEQLTCTGSQLTKLLKLEPKVFHLVNQRRQALGLRTLL